MLDEKPESNLLFHGPCDKCGSSDANAVYDDGHTYCFSCTAYGRSEGQAEGPATGPRNADGLLPPGHPKDLAKRRLTEETCRKYKYTVGEYHGQTVQIANYQRDGQIIAQKIRFPDKTFKFLGDAKNSGLYGQHLFAPGGKYLVITEGELDCLSVSQVQGNKWPVVSVPNGASGAAKSIRKELDFVSSFETVVIMFDMDEPGRAAAKEVASLLKPGQAKIAEMSAKDASELLQKGLNAEITKAFWDAKPYRPDGIINAAELWDKIKQPKQVGIPYPWEGLTKKTYGIRKGELVVLTAGSGVGKSAVVREIAYDLMNRGNRIGMLMLEESVERTAEGFVGLHLNKPIHITRDGVTEDELKAAFDATTGSGRLWLYDHFGSVSAGNLLDRIRYLSVGCQCDFVILDHISIAVSDSTANDGEDERKLIDRLMTQLRSLVEELKIGLFVISHLRRPNGDRGHEQGAMTSLSQLRGSHAIAQLADFVIGLERDQQNEETRHQTTVRVLKNRFSGDTGEASTLYYDSASGRLSEHGFTVGASSGEY